MMTKIPKFKEYLIKKQENRDFMLYVK